jgi:hypothetical protein
MEAFATMSSLEALASVESPVGARRHFTTAVLTGEAAVVGMARPVVGAVIEVVVVVSFMMLSITVAPIAKVLPTIVTIVAPIAKVVPTIVPPVGKVLAITVLPITKVTKVSVKIMVAVAEEEKRRKAHVKR